MSESTVRYINGGLLGVWITPTAVNSIAGIGTGHFKQNVAYIKGWLAALKNDKRLIIYASSQAQRATDYILNVPPLEKQ